MPHTYHYLCQTRRLQTLTLRSSECLSRRHPSQQLGGPTVEKEGLWKKHFAQWRRRSLSWKRSRKTAHRRRGQKLAELGQVESVFTHTLSLCLSLFSTSHIHPDRWKEASLLRRCRRVKMRRENMGLHAPEGRS